MRLGIIAEDDSDVAVVSEITLRLLRPRNIGTSRFVGHGCGKLRRKCGAWAANLVERGCPFIVVVHDLDVHDEKRLRADLTRAIAPAGAKASVVLLPKRELEAWLLYDAAAIAAAFRQHRVVKIPGDPERLQDPKSHLRQLIRTAYGREYLNTVHNVQIAKCLDIQRLKKSQSFSPHFGFTAAVKRMIG